MLLYRLGTASSSYLLGNQTEGQRLASWELQPVPLSAGAAQGPGPDPPPLPGGPSHQWGKCCGVCEQKQGWQVVLKALARGNASSTAWWSALQVVPYPSCRFPPCKMTPRCWDSIKSDRPWHVCRSSGKCFKGCPGALTLPGTAGALRGQIPHQL